MGDVYEEILVKKRATGADLAKKIGMICLVVLVALAGIAFMPLLLIAAVLLGFGANYLIQGLKLEYEYQYVNGDIDVDKIMNKSRRKKAGSYDLANLEFIAPSASHELDSYLNRKGLAQIDYTSGDPEVKTYTAIYNTEKGMQAVRFEQFGENIFRDLRRQAPRKVSREC